MDGRAVGGVRRVRAGGRWRRRRGWDERGGRGVVGRDTRHGPGPTGYSSQIKAAYHNDDFIKISNLCRRELYMIVEEDSRLLQKVSASGEVGVQAVGDATPKVTGQVSRSSEPVS